MSSINVSFAAKLAIATRRWIRNTRAPAAELQNLTADLANSAAMVRAKPVFQFSADLAAIPSSTASERARWRFAFHAQPFTQYLRVQMLLAVRDTFIPIKAYGEMTVRDAAGTIVGTARVIYGASGLGSPSDVPSEFGGTVPVTVSDAATGTSLITLTPDADYFVEFADFQYARLVSAAVWEISLLPDTANGYATNTTGAGSPIYADQRGLIAQTARLLHRRFASQLWNWTADSTPLALTATATNVVDATSTTVSTTTPGVTLDMSRRVTMRTATDGVPVVMWAYFSGVTSSAQAILKNSAGTALVTVDAPYADGWARGTGYLPASSGKYDLHGVMVGAAGNLAAVSLYELDYTPQTMVIAFTTVQSIRQRTDGFGVLGTDFSVSVTVYDGTQSNVQVVFTFPRNEAPSTGADNYATAFDLGQIATGWTAVVSTTATEVILTYTIASLAAGTHAFSVAGYIDLESRYAVAWRDEGTFNVVATGSSNDVPTATGDTTAITVAGLAATGAWSPTSVATDVASVVTITISPTTLDSSNHSINITIDQDEITTDEPTTYANPDGWTIGAWTVYGLERRCTISKAGSITAGTTNTIAFSVTPSNAGTLRSSGQLTAANSFAATLVIGDLTVTSVSSLAPIAALMTSAL